MQRIKFRNFTDLVNADVVVVRLLMITLIRKQVVIVIAEKSNERYCYPKNDYNIIFMVNKLSIKCTVRVQNFNTYVYVIRTSVVYCKYCTYYDDQL